MEKKTYSVETLLPLESIYVGVLVAPNVPDDLNMLGMSFLTTIEGKILDLWRY